MSNNNGNAPLLKRMTAKWNNTSGRLRLLLLTIVSLGLLFCIICPVAVYLLSRNVSYVIPLADAGTSTPIQLAGQLLDVNIGARTLSMEWYILPNDTFCSSPQMVDIYLDRNLLDSSSPGLGNDDSTVSNTVLQSPTFSLNGTEWCTNRGHPHENVVRFRSIWKLNDEFGATKARGSPLYYPYDEYFAQVYMYAVNPTTNASVGLSVEQTWGVVMDLDISLDKGHPINTMDGGLFYVLDISRSRAVKLAVLILVISCWAASVAFLAISIACFIYKSEEILKDVLVLPIAALFSFLQVRSVMPGSPPTFGTMIDFFGILPNLIIISFSSVVVLFVVLYRRSRMEDTPAPAEDPPEKSAKMESSTD
ncbi:hypothetical protein FRC18_007934 [Serendipita sp. 400]|nr:hypothetical protein FRC18_007934 [Serendipita sp. 400]